MSASVPNQSALAPFMSEDIAASFESATLNADGTVSFADANAPSNPFAPYNSIALLVHGAPSHDTGTKWNTSLAVQTGPTVADLTQVPVAATVTKIDGDALRVQGTGTKGASARTATTKTRST